MTKAVAKLVLLLIGFSSASCQGQVASPTARNAQPSLPELVLQKGHSGPIRDLDVSQDGKLAITGGDDGSIRLWDVATARELRRLYQGVKVQHVSLSPDGELAAAMSFQMIKVWNVKTGVSIATFTYFDSNVYFPGGLSFTPDGHSIIAADNARVFVWSITQKKILHVESFPFGITCLSAVANSNLIALCQRDIVVLWDSQTWKTKQSIGPVSAFPPSAAVLEYQKKLEEGQKTLLGDKAQKNPWDGAFVLSATVAPIPGRIITYHADNGLRVWNLGTGQLVAARKLDGNSLSLAANASAPIFAVCSGGDKVTFWDSITAEPVGEPLAPPAQLHYTTTLPIFGMQNGRVCPMKFVPDSNELIEARVNEDSLVFWNQKSRSADRVSQNTVGIASSRITPDGRWLATISGTVPKLWDMSGRFDVRRLNWQTSVDLVVSDNHEWIAWGDGSGYQVTSTDPLSESTYTIPGCMNQVNQKICEFDDAILLAVSFSDEGTRLITREQSFSEMYSGKVTTARFYEFNIKSGTIAKSVRVPVDAPVLVSAYSARTDLLAISEGLDFVSVARGAPLHPTLNKIRLFDWGTGKETPSLAFEPVANDFIDHALAAIPLENPERFADILQARTNQARGMRDNDVVTQIAFNSAGTMLAAGSHFHGVTVWNVTTGTVIFQTGPNFLPNAALGKSPAQLKFDGNGFLLAAGWDDGSLSIFDVRSGKEIQSWFAHDGIIKGLDFTPDASLLISAGEDGAVRVWKTADKSLQLTILPGVRDDDWAAVTPSGEFDGGSAGWARFIWRFGDSIFDTLPTEVFFREYFHPGLIAEILREKCTVSTR